MEMNRKQLDDVVLVLTGASLAGCCTITTATTNNNRGHLHSVVSH